MTLSRGQGRSGNAVLNLVLFESARLPTMHGSAMPGGKEEQRWHERLIEIESVLAVQHGTEQIALLMEMGEIWSEKLGDSDSAEMFFERVLALDPAHHEAFEQLDHIYTQKRSVADQIELKIGKVMPKLNGQGRIETHFLFDSLNLLRFRIGAGFHIGGITGKHPC